jgi:hypothetical protein
VAGTEFEEYGYALDPGYYKELRILEDGKGSIAQILGEKLVEGRFVFLKVLVRDNTSVSPGERLELGKNRDKVASVLKKIEKKELTPRSRYHLIRGEIVRRVVVANENHFREIVGNRSFPFHKLGTQAGEFDLERISKRLVEELFAIPGDKWILFSKNGWRYRVVPAGYRVGGSRRMKTEKLLVRCWYCGASVNPQVDSECPRCRTNLAR